MTMGRYVFKTYTEIYIIHKDFNKKEFSIIIDETNDPKFTYVGAQLSSGKHVFKINNRKFDVTKVKHRIKGAKGKLIIEIPAFKKEIKNVSSSKDKATNDRRNDSQAENTERTTGSKTYYHP